MVQVRTFIEESFARIALTSFNLSSIDVLLLLQIKNSFTLIPQMSTIRQNDDVHHRCDTWSVDEWLI
jgi:hypothetical protein